MASQPLLETSLTLTEGSLSGDETSKPPEEFNPIFGRPPLIRLETLTSFNVRWIFAVFYVSLGMTMYFRIEERKAYSCYPLCPQEPSYDSCMMDVISARDDVVTCANKTNGQWVFDLQNMENWNRWLYLYAGLDQLAEADSVTVNVNFTLQFLRSNETKTDSIPVAFTCPESDSGNSTISCGVEFLKRYDGVHNARYLIVDVAADVALSGLRFEALTGNKTFSIVELSFRCLMILITLILFIRLFVMLRLSVFSLWLPEHLWLLWVLLAMIFALDPFWYWGLTHDDFSSAFERFSYFEKQVLYDFCSDVVKAFEFLTLSSIRDAANESHWMFDGRMFKPAVWSSVWLFGITLNRVVRVATMPWDHSTDGMPNDFFVVPDPDADDFHFVVIKILFDFAWYLAIVLLTVRTSNTLEKLPYLQTRYRQLTFRFIVFLYLCFVVAWIPPYFIRMFLDHQPPPLHINIGELLGNAAYTCILAYVLTPITDYQHKLVYVNEIPDPSDRRWIKAATYNVDLMRFMKGDQSLFFFFTEEERDTFYASTEKAYDTAVAQCASEHYKNSEKHSLTEAKRAMARVREVFHTGMDVAKDKVMKSAQKAHESVVQLPTAMAALPRKSKEAAVNAASSVKQGVMHPMNTAASLSNRTFEICEQTVEKILCKLEPNTKPPGGLTRSFHGALGLPVVVGMREDDTSITVSPPSPEHRAEEASEPESPLGSERSFAASISSKKSRRPRSESHYAAVGWFLEWYDRITKDMFGYSPVPEPLFCLETSHNMFNLSWEAYFQDPEEQLTEDFINEVDKSLAKRAKKREKEKKKRLEHSFKSLRDKNKLSLKNLFKRSNSPPTFRDDDTLDSTQRRTKFKQSLPALDVSTGLDEEVPRSTRNTPFNMLRKNTFINEKHLLMKRRGKGFNEKHEKERVLLEVLEDKVYIDVEQYGYTLEAVVNKSQNQVIVAAKDDHISIAFRGTCNTNNVKTDLTLTRQKLEHISGSSGFLGKLATKLGLFQPRVHVGFYKVWMILRDDVIAAINRLTSERHVSKIYLTGHSLGGALATIAAWDITKWVTREIGVDKYGHPAVKISMYNFGCPRVGNPVFSNYYNMFVPDSFRVVNDGDVVCSTPPRLYIPFIGGMYRHAGKQVIIDWKGNFVIRPDFVERALPKWHLRRSDPTRHQMAGVAADVDAGRQTSYRSALNAVAAYCRTGTRCFQVLIQRLEEFDEDQLEATVRLTTTNARIERCTSLFDTLIMPGGDPEASMAVVVGTLCMVSVARVQRGLCALLKSPSVASHDTMLSMPSIMQHNESNSSPLTTPHFASRTQSVSSTELAQHLLPQRTPSQSQSQSSSNGRRGCVLTSPVSISNPLARNSQQLSSVNSTPTTSRSIGLDTNSLRYLLVRYGVAGPAPSPKSATPSSIASPTQHSHHITL